MTAVDELTSWRSVRFESERSWSASRRSQDHKMVELDGRRLLDEKALFRQLAKEFSFPDYFGSNWDAVDECLRDLGWLPAKGYVLVVRNATPFWHHSPHVAGALVESWLLAAESWASKNVPFRLVFLLDQARSSS